MTKRRKKLPPGECAYCDKERAHEEAKGITYPYHPPHDPSPRCESGKHNHCTCDTCF